ncbi:MAG: DNA internalization-related competence protein ComEC/Rec2 [Dehalococcoidia bacterium]
MRLIYLSLAWVFGIFLGMRYDLDWIYLAIPIGALLLIAIIPHSKKALLLGILCLIFLLGGILRFQSVPANDPLQDYQGNFHILRGMVSDDPEVGDSTTSLQLEVTEIRLNEKWQETSGTIQVYAPKFPAELAESRDSPYYRYGDLLEISGVLKSPNPPEEGEEFDFREYLARQGIYTVMYQPRGVKLLAGGQKAALMESIYSLRGSISQALEKVMPEPQCSLAKAMLLGQRTSVPTEVKEAFSRTGTAHLLAISGVHVSIVAGIALGAGILIFGRHQPYYVLLGLALVWLYVMLSGMRPSAIRAATMGSLWIYADWIGRPRSAFTALTFAAAVMLAFEPSLLATIAFQLSFAAMAGLIFLTPIFHDRSKRMIGGETKELSPAVNFVIGSCSVTLGAVLATLPLISYYFHMIPLVSLPATFFTLPAIPGIIVTVALTGIVGIFTTSVASVLGWISWLFVTYVLKVVDVFTVFPYAPVEFGTHAVWAYYGMLVAALWIPRNWSKLSVGIVMIRDRLVSASRVATTIPIKWVILPLLVLVALVWAAVVTTPDSRLHVFVFDVGQGDSILIQRGTQQILIDGGPSPEEVTNQLGDTMPFWDRTIELIVLTHPDSDHITGLVEVLQRYEVEKVLTSGQKNDSGTYIEWRKLIKEQNIERIVAKQGQIIAMGEEIELKVLHPKSNQFNQTDFTPNNNSVVLRLTHGDFSCLLAGDIEAEAEELLLDQDLRLRSTVLKVPHHGSSTSTTNEFLSNVDPIIAVVSVGTDNRFGHPTEKVINKLEEEVEKDMLFSTSEDGTVELITNGQKLWIGERSR